MRTITNKIIGLLGLAWLLGMTACNHEQEQAQLPGNEGSVSSPIDLSPDTPYWGSISKYPVGESFYRFTPALSGDHTIALTRVSNDLDVDWLVAEYGAGSPGDPVLFCENDVTNGDEVCTVTLTANVTMLLVVENFQQSSGGYRIDIISP